MTIGTKDIPGYENLYSISKDGKIWSIRTKRFLKLLSLTTGYLQAGFSINGKRKVYLVHRLVAQTYLKNPLNKTQINHKNGIKNDNRLINLEWTTAKENMNHASKNNLTAKGELNGNVKITKEIVNRIRQINNKTYTDIGKIFGISRVQVSNIINNRQWILQ